jgi:hypothetical protein
MRRLPRRRDEANAAFVSQHRVAISILVDLEEHFHHLSGIPGR